ncbi:polysaccharide pyruvyl transferase family protein [Sphingomonas sp. A2-49]|uniref:polysaccharide pyruvyl transferase family protein n=1 Tax=Sphingomonas sp. A2-49 TaxID=1391375 RepID=UPI0021D3E957|nr:polysaccharide pyruvyl transferase family protein [Sphingomonas sp. A2-49]MCU6454533.1 polysaccharide pyruvyl transferase family protein [Sphingomonas sp. A2-49]
MSAPDVVAQQQAALFDLYRRHVGPGDRYALVDFPDHANVGDSAIWLGEVAILRAVTGRDPDYVATWDGFDSAAFRAASPKGVVFLHGGGNLGDIWRHHQTFRETVLATVRDRRVVQLPQSIHFRAPGGIAAFGTLVAAHPDFHLAVRDRASLALAQRHWDCPVTLAPDSAFAIGRQHRGVADVGTLLLLRSDDERVAHDPAIVGERPDALVCDWLDDGPLPGRTAGEPAAAYCHRLARARVDRGLALLSRGRRIVTDRLHAHILATLLDIPHVALDNDYGKLSAYIACWTAASPLLAARADGA